MEIGSTLTQEVPDLRMEEANLTTAPEFRDGRGSRHYPARVKTFDLQGRIGVFIMLKLKGRSQSETLLLIQLIGCNTK